MVSLNAKQSGLELADRAGDLHSALAMWKSVGPESAVLSHLLVMIAGYFLGSIPTGFLVARARGIDIRTVGSGNIGATNVFRILGKSAGIFVLLVDALKGVAGCRLAPYLAQAGGMSETEMSADRLSLLLVIGGVSAILGHNYTCWLKFKGGKGVATTAGVLAALIPIVFVMALVLWGLVLAVTRYVSLASIIAAVALPVLTWWTGQGRLLIGVMTAIGALAVYKHKSNMIRLIQGTENRLGSKKTGSTEIKGAA